MARPGPQAKNTPKHGHGGAGWVDVPNVPYTGPGSEKELPPIPGMQWLPQVEAWWEVVRSMPHCILWEASDWLVATELALLKNNYYAELFGGAVHATMVTAIRIREDQLGLTVEARRKNGIRYVDPAQVPQNDAETAPQVETATGESQPAGGGVRPIGSAKSRRQQLAG